MHCHVTWLVMFMSLRVATRCKRILREFARVCDFTVKDFFIQVFQKRKSLNANGIDEVAHNSD